jgi:hypothetical protein
MASDKVKGQGTKEDSWILKTPPGRSEYQMYRDEGVDPPALVCVVGTTKPIYQLRCLEDLHAMLKEHGVLRQRGSKMPGDERFISAHSPPSTSHDAPMQSPGISSISCR